MKTKTLILVFSFFIAGCAPTGRYYWGKYSISEYQLMKNADDASRTQHKNELLEIIRMSKKYNKPVPPGICAELGYMYYNEGNYETSLSYFNSEMTNYPESAPLMKVILVKAEEMKKKNESVKN